MQQPYSRARLLQVALAVAPAAAAICTAASWIRFYISGTLELRPGLALTLTSGTASAALAILGVCCFIGFYHAGQNDLRRLLHCSLLVHGFLLLAIPLQDTDLFLYLGHGSLVAHGLNPHRVGVVALGNSPLIALSPWTSVPSPYGPIATLLASIGGVLGKWAHSPIWVSGVTYKVLSGSLDIWSLWIASAIARRSETTSAARGFAMFALNPLLAWTVAAQAHNDGLVVLAGLIFLSEMQQNRDLLGSTALTLGTMAKFVLAPVLALYLLIISRHSIRRALLLGALSASLAGFLLSPWWSGAHSLLSVLQPAGLPADTVHSTASIHWVLYKLQLHSHMSNHAIWNTYQGFNRLSWGFVLVLFAAVARRISKSTLAHAALIVLLSLIATRAWLMNWYFLWPLPFAIVETDHRWQRLVLGTTVFAVLVSGPTRLGLLIQPLLQLAVIVAILKWRAWNLEQPDRPVLLENLSSISSA